MRRAAPGLRGVPCPARLVGAILSLPLDGPLHALTVRHLDSHEFRLVANGVVAGGLLGWTAGQAGQAAAARLSAGVRPVAGTAPRDTGP